MNSDMPVPTPESFSGLEPLLTPVRRTRSISRRWGPWLGQGIGIISAALLSYYLIAHFLLQSVTVVGVSMTPSLQDSQRYLLNRWIYHVRSPHCSEVVVLRDPSDNGYAVKRIIGMPGDSISIEHGDIFVNGLQVQEPYLVPGTRTFPASPVQRQSFKCAPDQFFVLGDNRNNSMDSRVYGPISRRNILGLVIW